MESKSILVGVVIGIIVGGFLGFMAAPSTDVSVYENQISQLQSQVVSLQNDVISAQSDLAIKEAEIQQLKTTVNNLQDTVEDYADIQEELDEKDTQIKGLKATVKNLESEIETLQAMVPPAAPSEGEPGSSRFFPAEVGATITCPITVDNNYYTVFITIKDIIRGETAWSMILNANMFNDPPIEGYEYILVKIAIKYTGGPTAETALSISEWDFEAVSEDGVVYETPLVVSPPPEIAVDLYMGATHEGWATYQILKTDSKPLFAFARSEYGAYWFTLYT